LRQGVVSATVRGQINPYFGVYKEPRYKTRVALQPISTDDWAQAINRIGRRADLLISLLMSQMPDAIEDAFASLGRQLLPGSQADFTNSCSCPDWANPCKHIAAVYFLLASDLDQDPFLLFELRGLSRQRLRAELVKSPLGASLAAELASPGTSPAPATSYFTELAEDAAGAAPQHRAFWMGTGRLPEFELVPAAPGVRALLVKEQGDYPAFWRRDQSFIAAMEELYERVRTKSSQLR
jgi:uncharacterized Zn finger protein